MVLYSLPCIRIFMLIFEYLNIKSLSIQSLEKVVTPSNFTLETLFLVHWSDIWYFVKTMHLAPDTEIRWYVSRKKITFLKTQYLRPIIKYSTGNEPMDIIFETHKMENFLIYLLGDTSWANARVKLHSQVHFGSK